MSDSFSAISNISPSKKESEKNVSALPHGRPQRRKKDGDAKKKNTKSFKEKMEVTVLMWTLWTVSLEVRSVAAVK